MKSTIKDMFSLIDVDKEVEKDKDYQKLKNEYLQLNNAFIDKLPYDLHKLFAELMNKYKEVKNIKYYLYYKKEFSNGVCTILESTKEN